MWIGPLLKLKDSAKQIYFLNPSPHNQKSFLCDGFREYKHQSTNPLYHMKDWLLSMPAPLIDIVLDNGNPLIVLNVALMEMEMWKALH